MDRSLRRLGERWRYVGGEMPRESHFNRPLFWLCIVAITIAQFALCYDALVCRGYPSLTEIAFYKKWASPFLIWLPAVFGTRAMRFCGLAVLAFSTTCLFVMISINGMMRPSIGHLAGVTGILHFHFSEVIFETVIFFPFTFAIMLLPERVFGDLWRSIFLLPTANIPLADTLKLLFRITPSANAGPT